MEENDQTRIIEVVPYDEKWRKKFINESIKIRNIMRDEVINIYHIGSTAIPGIYAKPIIDILVEVKKIEIVDIYNDKMMELGYVPKGEFGIEKRRFFIKGLYKRTYHVHIFQSGNSEIQRHLKFRDYMISHLEDAKRYENLKKELALKFRYDIESYCKGKDDFIKAIDKKIYNNWIDKMIKVKRNVLTAEQFNNLVKRVGWKVNSNKQVNIALQNSLYTVSILYNDEIIGMGRMLGDKSMSYFIRDIVVLPEYQGKGIGRKIIEDMMSFIKETNPKGCKCLIELTSASEKEGFYGKFGFQKRPCETSGAGMFLLME
ncbi:GNAT family N-acetyltransferase [Clostridium botulinum C/D]|nr:GNAT family N-acetyltransferase [Clostridium botulinum C/D]NFF29338.1 GNAT family N-acetyltransferase [Clostridium botulinum]MCD3202013.1 GNAT family N-acetyltransferase [Clostridium botulinum C/D]MCD3212016.1 GNAT family N-acetyltransferase [Clostridium botulinum C/D]MCD3214249.1 GNAT family N-acetyltransferase [Clostridium botulinum C/D]